ncbi:DivIVA domain-containing protein [Micromonospora sp. WMMA1363]|uniref:DivIVA domain-containing protein n=1 Tax=Micromonospora sp. WMMA1363 TaxID=3053985 RepID=UPI00259CB618|nr:DivIVA domain-containing protein [Micromonospora sp. WMMA1363]MDM4722333.1 DivIVA domain-containing protein [Micromonospora sp. WMMA1363]
MGQVLLLLVVALTVAAVVFGVTVLVSGRDPGLVPAEPDGTAVPLPGTRPLRESDLGEVRFDTALRGYRMAQVDQAMRRAAYDIGYKSELIEVLEAEVVALREGRTDDAEALRSARERAVGARPAQADPPPGVPEDDPTPPAGADDVQLSAPGTDSQTGTPTGGADRPGTPTAESPADSADRAGSTTAGSAEIPPAPTGGTAQASADGESGDAADEPERPDGRPADAAGDAPSSSGDSGTEADRGAGQVGERGPVVRSEST